MTFTSIFDPKVKAISIIENNEPLVDVAASQKIIVSNKFEEFYPTFKLVRQSVFERLQNVADNLPDDIFLLFIEGHRPIEIQEQLFTQYSAVLRRNNPDWDEDTIFDEAGKLIAPPSKIPPHSTGSAIDISFCDKNGTPMDMGSPVDDDPNLNDGRNFIGAKNINNEAQERRAMLNTIMIDNNFANYDYEWWHWSYGDQYWAFKTNAKNAVYGTADATKSPLWQEPKEMDYFK